MRLAIETATRHAVVALGDGRSIAASASANGHPKALARRLPTAVLPAPIMPISTTVRSMGRSGAASIGDAIGQ